MTVKAYPAYRESGIEWIGLVPSEWQQRPFFAAVRERREKNRGLKEDNLLSLSYGNIVQKDMTSNDGLLPASFETYQVVRPLDVVFRLTDLQNDKRSLRSALVGEKGIITSAYLAVTPVAHDSRYFAFLMRAYDAQKVFYSMGGGLRQSMKFDDMKHLPVVAPTLDEQRQIADYLDTHTVKIDMLIGKQEQLIETLAERRQAVISHAVTKGLDPNAAMKDSGVAWLADVPSTWELRPLWSMFERIKDVGHPDETMLSVFRDLGVVVKDQHLNLNQTAENRNIYQLVGPGWLVTNRMKAWQGSVGISDLRGIVSGHYICFAPMHLESAKYLNYLFRSAPYAAGYSTLSRGVRIGQAEIDNDQYRLLPVAVPPLEEQDAIVNLLDRETSQIDELSAKAREMIDVLKERRQALISAAVTGKIDVRGLA